MTREEFESFVFENYNALCDRPWARHPDHQVFRHPENGKWFALAAVPDDMIKLLVEMSFDATKEKKRASR